MTLNGIDISPDHGSISPMTQAEIDMSRVVVAPTGCWEWTGAKNKRGHGRMWIAAVGHVEYVHRVSYENTYGPIPEGYIVHHRCENPPCIKPAHLVAITRKEHAAEHGLTGTAVAHAAQDTCEYGHPFDGHDGHQRTCSECRRRIAREWARKKRQDPAYRAQINERKRAWRAARREGR